MISLILYTADGYSSFGIADTERLLYSSTLYAPRKGTEIYMPAIEHAFSMLGLSSHAIGRVLCTVGPSSFTATRLILSTALGITTALDVPIASISTLQAITLSCSAFTQPLLVILQAQKNTVYAQNFIKDATKNYVAQGEICVYSLEELIAYCASRTEPIYIVGSGVALCMHEIEVMEHCTILPEYMNIPTMFSLFLYASHAEYTKKAPEAYYVRTTDAEENVFSIANALGYTHAEVEDVYKEL